MSKLIDTEISGSPSSSDDERKPDYIDSSQSDEEKAVTSKFHDVDSYVDFLTTNSISLEEMRADSNELKQQLGLVMHHYADRVFNSSEFQGQYKESKSKLFDLGEEIYNATVNNITGFLQKHVESEGNMFIDPAAVINLDPKEKIQLFNYIFNEDVSLSDDVKLNTEVSPIQHTNARASLLNSLQTDDNFNT